MAGLIRRGGAAASRAGRLARRVPLLANARPHTRAYWREDFPHDLMAGLAVTVITVPQALAYAFLAGLPPVAGLYACLLPMAFYALFGSSRQLVVGPVAIAALMVANTLGEYAPAYSDRYAAIAVVLSLEVGAVLLLLRLARMGGLASLLSHPVIAGFVNAAAILIIVSQIAGLAGLAKTPPAGLGAQLAALAGSWQAINPTALAIGVASLALLWGVRGHLGRVLPGARRDHPLCRAGPLLVAAAATGAVAMFDLPVDTVGAVPAGLPRFAAPAFDAALWWSLAPNAAIIALVVFAESYSVARSLATRERRAIDANQELTALGGANIAAAFFGAYPVAGSFGRSSVNQAAGARSQMSALVCAAVIVVTLLWLTPLFEQLPRAALAAIVISAVWRLLDFRALGEHWRFHRPDAATHAATFAGVLVVGVEGGLLIGVAVSVALFLRAARAPHIAVVGRLPGTPHFRNVLRFDVETWPEVLIARVDESVFFANADPVEARLLALTARPAARHLVLVMSAVNFVDASGLEMLRRLSGALAARQMRLHLCEVKGPVRDQLEHARLPDWLTGAVHTTADAAVGALAEQPR